MFVYRKFVIAKFTCFFLVLISLCLLPCISLSCLLLSFCAVVTAGTCLVCFPLITLFLTLVLLYTVLFLYSCTVSHQLLLSRFCLSFIFSLFLVSFMKFGATSSRDGKVLLKFCLFSKLFPIFFQGKVYLNNSFKIKIS